MGAATTASGTNSTAIGVGANASGSNSVAIGVNDTASGYLSFALGSYVSTNGYAGSNVIGDASTTITTNSTAANQMTMRFAGGYKLYTNSSTIVGAQLAAGGNSWSTISDRRKKENFATVDGEDFLKKIATFKLTSWNYKGQDAKTFRHYGPMAQDFYAAFGHDKLGTIGNDTTINQADFEGVSFIAIQTLEQRTQEIAKLKAENEQLKNEIASIKAMDVEKYANIMLRLQKLEANTTKSKSSSKVAKK
jgi:hypothetical protein